MVSWLAYGDALAGGEEQERAAISRGQYRDSLALGERRTSLAISRGRYRDSPYAADVAGDQPWAS